MPALPNIAVLTVEKVDTEDTSGPSAGFILDGFLGYTQQQRNWCWAAVCVAINNYFSDPSSYLQQCEVVNRAFNETECCLVPGRYDVPWSLEYALDEVGHLACQIPGAAGAAGGFAALMREIGVQHRPVAVRNDLPDGGRHFVVICGYKEHGHSLLIWNPAGYYLQTSLTNWLKDIGGWVNTYFTC